MGSNRPLHSQDELARLRQTAQDAGLQPMLSPEALGVQLDTADELLARVRGDADSLNANQRDHRRWVLAASAVAASAALIVGILQPWQSQPAAADTPPVLSYEFANAKNIAYAPGRDASATLLHLAAGAAAAKVSTSTPRQRVQHVVTDNWFVSIDDNKGSDSAALVPTVNETWLSADGSFRLLERKDSPLAPDGRGLPLKGSWTTLPPKADEKQPADSVDANLLVRLPSDSSELSDRLLELTQCDKVAPGNSRAYCLMNHFDEYSSTYVVPARVTSAFWRLLADQRATKLLGKVDDRAGRAGVAVSIVPDARPQYRLVLIANPQTGELLGIEEILIKTTARLKLTAPSITRFTAFLAADYVSNAKATQ